MDRGNGRQILNAEKGSRFRPVSQDACLGGIPCAQFITWIPGVLSSANGNSCERPAACGKPSASRAGIILRDATIQRFEFTFEAAWKTLQLFLLHQGLETTGPRQVLKQAFALGLIPTLDEADIWLAMLEDRNLTTHTYREDPAETIAAHIRADYAARLVDLAQTLAALKLD